MGGKDRPASIRAMILSHIKYDQYRYEAMRLFNQIVSISIPHADDRLMINGQIFICIDGKYIPEEYAKTVNNVPDPSDVVPV